MLRTKASCLWEGAGKLSQSWTCEHLNVVVVWGSGVVEWVWGSGVVGSIDTDFMLSLSDTRWVNMLKNYPMTPCSINAVYVRWMAAVASPGDGDRALLPSGGWWWRGVGWASLACRVGGAGGRLVGSPTQPAPRWCCCHGGPIFLLIFHPSRLDGGD